MVKTQVCIAGKNDIAVLVLERLIKIYDKDCISVVCNSTDTGENGFQRSFKKYAKKVGVQEYTLEETYAIDNLVFISLEYNRIIDPNKFKAARLYNIHFSLLPQYKGMYTSAHPVLNGEHKTGVTLHRIDAGIDTGDIIDQKEFIIEDTDNCKDVYLKYIKTGTEVVLRNLEDLIYGSETAYSQPCLNSSYYSKNSLDYSHLIIDLKQTAEGIARQIKAFSFRDFQLPQVMGHKIIDYKILKSKSASKPGKCIFEMDNGMILSTIDYDIALYFDRFEELMLACEKGDLELVKEITAVTRHINEKDEHGWSPLIKATYYNQINIVKYLISVGADIHVKNNNGTNLLMYAKEAYLKTKDCTLYGLYKELGLSEKEKDYSDRDLLFYVSGNSELEQLVWKYEKV